MDRISLRLLGGFEIRRQAGPPIEFPTKRCRALLAYLAVCASHACSREKLAALLWENSGEQQARASLRQALSYVRKSLGDGEYLVTNGDTVTLVSDGFDIDVGVFEQAATSDAPDGPARAGALYRGEFLDGFDLDGEAFEDWLRAERIRLRELAVSCWERLLTRNGDIEQSIQTAVRLLSVDPLREDIHRRLMALYVRRGRLSSAIAQYEACRDVLKRELDVAPQPETEKLYRDIRRSRGGAAPALERHGARPPGRWIAAAFVAAAAVASAVFTAYWFLEPPDRVAVLSRIPEGPSIAVLPFEDLSPEPDTFFARGFHEDLITELASNRNLFVIARNSVAQYVRGLGDKAVDVREAGAALGARYIVESSIDRSGGRIRITAQLIEAQTAHHLWATRYDRQETSQGLFALRDELSREIASYILPQIKVDEERRALGKPPKNLTVYDLTVQGRHYKHMLSPESMPKAKEALRKAIELDPDYAEAHAYLGYTLHVDHSLRLTGRTGPETNDEAMVLLQTAVRLKPDLAVAYQAMSSIRRSQGHIEGSVAAAQRSVELGPNDAENWIFYSGALWQAGRIDEAVEAGDRAMRHNPFAPVYYLAIHGRTLYYAERYDDARRLLSACTARHPGYRTCRPYLAATLVQLGEMDAAFREIDESLARWPGLTIEGFIGQIVSDPDIRSRVIEDLRKAGLPATGP